MEVPSRPCARAGLTISLARSSPKSRFTGFIPFQTYSVFASMPQYRCEICSYREGNIRLFVKHLRRHERARADFSVSCPKCPKKLPDSRSWLRHLLTPHETKESASSLPSASRSTDDPDICPQSADEPSPASVILDVSSHEPNSEERSSSAEKTAKFLLAREFKSFGKTVVAECNEALQASCKHAHSDIDPDSVPSIASLNEADRTSKRQDHARKNLMMVEAETITLGSGTDGKVQSYQFVPVSKQLEVLLRDESFRSQLFSERGGKCRPTKCKNIL